MIENSPIFRIIGMLLAMLGGAMLAPAFADGFYNNKDWQIFAVSSMVTILFGLGLAATAPQHHSDITLRQAVLMTVATWLILPLFAALPFYWSGVAPHFTDAFFEAMSGITTTGATVFTGLDTMPPGILLWRAMLQWLGGLGVIVMAIAVMPMLRIGGMQLFKAEAFEAPEKILPRATQISGIMTVIFAALTFLCALAYYVAGMRLFDAICHAMTTVATGGFSTRDASFGFFDNRLIDSVGIVFMILGSLPFLLYLKMLQGRPQSLFYDSQVRLFLAIILLFTLLLWIYQAAFGIRSGGEGLIFTLFNVVSIMTGTGYASDNYGAWGPFAVILFFILTFLGGCAGSTSCGMKTFRLEVALETVIQHLKRATIPHGVFVMRYAGRTLEDSVVAAVMSFIFLYMSAFALLSVLLSLTGLSPLTAISGAATAIANVGPGLGELIGPASTFYDVNITAKWLLCFGMLLGRLELFTVLVLLMPRFWNR